MGFTTNGEFLGNHCPVDNVSRKKFKQLQLTLKKYEKLKNERKTSQKLIMTIHFRNSHILTLLLQLGVKSKRNKKKD